MLIAVYGTLKSGFGNNRLMQGSKLVGTGHIKGHRLFQSGIPYVVKDDTSEYEIEVELYDVPTEQVPRIDSLEGHPDWYRRELTEVHMQGDYTGTPYQAHVYKMPRQPSGTRENTSGVY